ncbi:MAG: 5-bromo-4-chloroindolyl phosphate hydrolysis family protein [Tissierellia bacterium]|nr:5-bromo-4-chloroindolyl phosphate hydrolysis family protein [Tissierellia bacterium]
MKGSFRQSLLGTLSSLVVFGLLFALLKWPIFVAGPLAVGSYFGVYGLAKPRLKIGDLDLESLAHGQELKALYDRSLAQVQALSASARAIEDPKISSQAQDLAQTARHIMDYLRDNPKDLSQSRHFLDYYLGAGNRIVGNYQALKEAQISKDKFDLISQKTEESLDLLNEVYRKQRDGYHQDKLMDLEVESELLEKTLKLGGGRE